MENLSELQDLIGLDEPEARKILEAQGKNNIETIVNSKPNQKTDTKIVCAVREENEKITLVCGEFYVKIKGEKDG